MVIALALVSLINVSYDVTCWRALASDTYICVFVDQATNERFVHYCRGDTCEEVPSKSDEVN